MPDGRQVSASLIDRLNDARFQQRVAVVVCPAHLLHDPDTIALQLSIGTVDAISMYRQRFLDGAGVVGITLLRLREMVSKLAHRRYDYRTMLVLNLDILLARLTEAERVGFWSYARNGVRKGQTGVLVLLPDTADPVFPPSERAMWERTDRLIRFGNRSGHMREAL